MSELYDILGVPNDASQDDIRKAYKSKAGKHHPDKNPDDPESTVRFQAVQKAYAVLKDPEKRQRYDETGSTGDGPTLDELANNAIATIYLDLAQRAHYAPKDYILETRKAIQGALRQCMAEKRSTEQQHQRLEYLIKNTAASDMLVQRLETKLAELRHQMAHAEEGSKVMGRSLELLDEYKYTGEVPHPAGGWDFPWMNVDPHIS